MSWLSKKIGHPGFNLSTLGNLVKNLAPVAGVALGGPAGLALAGGLGAAGEAGRGKTKLSELLKAGISNAGIAAGGQSIGSKAFGFHGVGKPSTTGWLSSGPKTATPFTPSSTVGAETEWAQDPGWTPSGSSVAGKVPSPSLASQVGSKLGTFGGAVNKYAPALQVAGQVAGGVLGARAQDAQTGIEQQKFDFQKQQYEDQEKRRKQLAELLAPLLGQRGIN